MPEINPIILLFGHTIGRIEERLSMLRMQMIENEKISTCVHMQSWIDQIDCIQLIIQESFEGNI